jgi:peptidoglycan/LPS O-acetylase OafA/YrhL
LSASLRVTAATGGNAGPEVPGLTSLRGIAAVTVMLYHGSFFAFHYAGVPRLGSGAADLLRSTFFP